jgi:hypothetical protein
MEIIIVKGRKLEADQIIDGILVNPVNPPLGKLDMIRRSAEDLEPWRNRPFIMRADNQWKVMCLDNRFTNGATIWAAVDNMKQALRFAKGGGIHQESTVKDPSKKPSFLEGAETALLSTATKG